MKAEDRNMTDETKKILDELRKLNDKVTDIQLTLKNESRRLKARVEEIA